MKVLDATFLVDYLDGVEATREFYEEHGAEEIRWVAPVPALAEALVGEGTSRAVTSTKLAKTWPGSTFIQSTSGRSRRRGASRTKSPPADPTWTGRTH